MIMGTRPGLPLGGSKVKKDELPKSVVVKNWKLKKMVRARVEAIVLWIALAATVVYVVSAVMDVGFVIVRLSVFCVWSGLLALLLFRNIQLVYIIKQLSDACNLNGEQVKKLVAEYNRLIEEHGKLMHEYNKEGEEWKE